MWRRVNGYRGSVRTQLRTAFSQDHAPRDISASFALGLFVTALPTLGTGLLVLAAIGRRWNWANRVVFAAAVAVLNPLAKGAVYVASFALGIALLGPVPNVPLADVSLSAGSAVVIRLLAGNLLLASLFAVLGYGLAFYGVHTVRHYQR